MIQSRRLHSQNLIQIMRERDLNCLPREAQLHRLKHILFPKSNHSRILSRVEQSSQNAVQNNGAWIRSQISRLRGEIHSMMERGRTTEGLSIETQRAYLNGVNQLSKNLKHYASQINEAFDDFLTHLPTTALHKKNYSNSYYLSMLIQNSAWSSIQKILKRPLAEAFHLLREQNVLKRQQFLSLQTNHVQVQARIKNRLFHSASKYFHRWRYNSMCASLTAKSQQYLKDNNLEYDRKIQQSLLNFPLIVLILEELVKQTADISQLLVLDDKKTKVCKFMEQGEGHFNSSIETVTQRSILQTGERGLCKFSRFEFDLRGSLTRNCVQRGEIMFISSLSKNIDYSDIDNCCAWQTQSRSNSCLKGGAVFYPLFDSSSRCIGLLRQYFYEGPIKAVRPEKIEKIRSLLELSISLDKKMSAFARQRHYQKQGYYLKMISLIKRIQLQVGTQTQVIEALSEELKNRFGIAKLIVYKVEPRHGANQIFLQSLFGESDECDFLLGLADQLMKQQQSHVYLQSRLVVYSRLMLFDMQLGQGQYGKLDDRQSKLLPVQLLVQVMSKVQAVLQMKRQEFRVNQMQVQKSLERQREKGLRQLDEAIKGYSIELLSTVKQNDIVLHSIAAYLQNIWNGLQKQCFAAQEDYKQPVFYLECLVGKSRRDRLTFRIHPQEHLQEIPKNQCNRFSSNFIKISFSQFSTLFIDFRLKEGLRYIAQIYMTIGQYINNCFQRTQQRITKTCKTHQILEKFNRKIAELQFLNKCDQSQKKHYELELIKSIYSSFSQAVCCFCQNYLNCGQKPIWQKAEPQASNQMEWKQLLYKTCEFSALKIEIVSKNQMLNMEEYLKCKFVVGGALNFIKQQSWLVIGKTASLHRIKSMASDEQLVIKLPLFFQSSYAQHDSGQNSVREGLLNLKQVWCKLCKSLLQFNRLYSQGCLQQGYYKVAILLQHLKQKNLRSSLAALNRQRLAKTTYIKSVYVCERILVDFSRSLLHYSFSKIMLHSNTQAIIKTKKYANKNNVQKLCSLSARVCYSTYFGTIKSYLFQRRNVQNGLISLEKLFFKLQQSIKRSVFCDVLYFTRKQTLSVVLCQTVTAITKGKLNLFFSKIYQHTCQSSLTHLQTQTFDVQKCLSLKQISKQIHNVVPQYTVYYMINQYLCYSLHVPIQIAYDLVALDQVYSSAPPGIIYQIGSQTQLVWIYQVAESGSCFQIKDKLNYVSKCIEAALKQCRCAMEIKLSNLSCIRRSFLRNLKVSYWRRWKQSSIAIGMQEQNRLNDSLYQITLQTQTVKQKLKGQEKALRNNFLSYQQLQSKQQQYKSSILYNSAQALKIEQAHTKLQNARVLSNILHRRTVVKSCFLLWRSNCLALKLSQIHQKAFEDLTYVKIGLRSIFIIVSDWYFRQLGEVFLKIRGYRKQSCFKIKQIQKLNVSFEEKGSRLITFQSNANEQQNSSRICNSLQSSLNSQDLSQSVANKFRLQKMQHEKVASELTADQLSRYNSGTYKLNAKTLKFLKRMGKLES